jgi:DNA replication protein DnaC
VLPQRHVAKALAYQATLQGYDVLYLEADTEFARYALAGSQDRANLLREWVRPDLLIVDDLFLARRTTARVMRRKKGPQGPIGGV